jgi:GMP synthase-like glutamine amidotransferase
MPRSRTVLVIENEEGAGPAELEISAVNAGLELDVRSVSQPDTIPGELGDVAGLVVLGASYDVADAPEWPHLYRVMDLIRAAGDRDLPALGICLGGQLASEALGGSVQKAAGGVEIGWITVRPTEKGRDDPIGRAVGDGAPLFQWHHDVFTVPPGAVQVLTSDGSPVQGFRMGSVWGVQSHPEAGPDILAEWCSLPDAKVQLDAAGISADDLIEGAKEFSLGARRLLDAWCRVVSESV